MDEPCSPFLRLLKNRITLNRIPFTDRGSRILLYAHDHHFSIRLAERWIKRDHRLSAYRLRVPIMDELFLLDENGNYFEDIAYYAVVGNVENGRVLVLVNGYDDIRRLHAGKVLYGS